MRRFRSLLLTLATLLGTLAAYAQEVNITVTPKQSVLPPQIAQYIYDPSQLFTVTLTNTTTEDMDVYLTVEIEQEVPKSGLNVHINPNYQPNSHLTLIPGSKTLDALEIKNIFMGVPNNQVSVPSGLVEGYTNGSFGLLPEGQYRARFVAYKWAQPKYATPQVCSTPSSGECIFNVCYKAQPPRWQNPFVARPEDIAEFTETTIFSWQVPQGGDCALNGSASYKYQIKMVELTGLNAPDYCLEHNPTVYMPAPTTSTTHVISQNVFLNNLIQEGKTYVAQITATPTSGSAMNYVSMVNGGKSEIRLLRYKKSAKSGDDEDISRGLSWDFGLMGEELGDRKYEYLKPVILSPFFEEGTTRNIYRYTDIELKWVPCDYVSQSIKMPDNEIKYEVQLFKGTNETEGKLEETLKLKPFYTKKDLTEHEFSIPWNEIEDNVSEKSYIVLRILPSSGLDDKIDYIGSNTNVVDFVMTEKKVRDFFKCSSTVEIDNTTPTTKKAKDFEGTTVGLGEYQLTIESIENDSRQKNSFKGRGYVEWDLPVGTAHVKVEFDTLKINTQDIVYGGLAHSYGDPAQTTASAAVEKLFSDSGLDDWLVRADVPYAKDITQAGKSAIADNVSDVTTYYEAITKVDDIYTLLKGGKADIYTPIRLPIKELGFDAVPVDLQVTTMVFSPTWATMDVLGEFKLPDNQSLSSDAILLGCPRLCISPTSLLPEAGTLALMDKFTVNDPKTGFECTFNAPEDPIAPTNGNYIAWKDHKFEVMCIDIDMAIPGTKKCDATGKPTNQLADLHVMTEIGINKDVKRWADLIFEAEMEPFEVNQLEGFTFEARDIVLDLSSTSNSSKMAEFPKDYDKTDGIGSNDPRLWEGLYIGDLSISMPEGLVGSGDNRLKLESKEMFFDQSGVTLKAGYFASDPDGLQASAGGFSIGLTEASLNVIQDDFKNCLLKGTLGLPLLKNNDGDKSKIGFTCQIRKQLDDSKKEQKNYAMVFNTESLNGDYNLDLLLANLKLEDELTYFLLEVEKDNAGETRTRAELMLGGRIEIGGKNAEDKSIGYALHLPDIHFVGMRIANCDPWESNYVDFQYKADEKKKDLVGKSLVVLSDGKEYVSPDGSFHFDTGAWSLASAKKQLGPFEFSLNDYGLVNESGKDGKVLVGLKVTGTVALVKGLDISATVHDLKILGYIDNIGLDLSNIDVGFEKVSLGGLSVNTSFCGITLEGGVMFYDGNDQETVKKYFEEKRKDDVNAFDVNSFDAVGKGFMAYFRMALPGDFLNISASGGFFNTSETGEKDFDEDYSWGWIYASIDGKAGIQMPPVVINKLGGGFYWNCRRNDAGYDKMPVNKNGLVGFVFDLGLATSDGNAIKGDFQLAVVYNRKRNCLTNFTLTGRLVALGGIVNANASIVYENNDLDKYFQINITVDATLSAESMVGALTEFGGGLGSIKEQLETLVGKANLKEVVAGAKDGLGSKIGSGGDSPKEDLKEGELPPVNDKQEKEPSSEDQERAEKQGTKAAGASVSLDFKITWKKNGEELSKPLWHLYLGEPDEKKRCSFVIIDFDIEIVSAKIGANAYFCVGNELPNNGALPPIPAKITEFLDGGSHGDGYVSDNISDANASREKALAGFKTDFGVMLGAQVYGALAINLGIIYGDIDALAGFDVSLVHFKNGYCSNLGQKPGYRGWYGRGQLYAYLAMALGVRFNLGFVNFDIPLVKAAVGGLLKFGGPSPTYFEGKVRAKLELMGGLFKLNKSYSFEVGQSCKLFHGNPLDDFMLFNDCVIGDTNREDGWADEDKDHKFVDPNLNTPVYVGTDAATGEHFRLLDLNKLDEYAERAGFDEGTANYDKLRMEACRTFIFHTGTKAVLLGYNKPSEYKEDEPGSTEPIDVGYAQRRLGGRGAVTTDYIPMSASGTSTHHYLDMPALRKALKPNMYYALVFVGNAKELQRGKEEDPYTCDETGNNCRNREWYRERAYFFRTSDEKIIDDIAPLEDYIALAYPSDLNKLHSNEADSIATSQMEKGVDAYLNDVQSPVIALTDALHKKAFKNGRLYWRLLNPMGRQIDIAENRWVEMHDETGKLVGVNMEPSRRLNAAPNSHYILMLDYVKQDLKRSKEDRTILELDKDGNTMYEIVADTTLLRLHVHTLPSHLNWVSGRSRELGSCEYDQPFIACKMTDKSLTKTTMMSDLEFTRGQNWQYLVNDPFAYIAYHSNFAFPAGWELTERKFFGFEVLTSESMIFNDPGGAGKYEGVYNDKQLHPSNTAKDYEKLIDMVFYTLPTGKGEYDQPSTAWPLSEYWQTGTNNKWKYVYHTDPRIRAWQHTGTDRISLENLEPLLGPIHKVYDAVEKFDYYLKCPDWQGKNVSHRLNMSHFLLRHKYNDEDVDYSIEEIRKDYTPYRGEYLTEEGFVNQVERENIQDVTEDENFKKEAVARTSKLDSENGNSVDTNDKRYRYDKYIIMLPAYQIPCAFAAGYLEDRPSGTYDKMDNNCDRAKASKWVVQSLSFADDVPPCEVLERVYPTFLNFERNYKPSTPAPFFDAASAKAKVTKIDYQVYRVNAFDFEHGTYTINTHLLNGSAYRTGSITNPLKSKPSMGKVSGESAYNYSTTSSSTIDRYGYWLDEKVFDEDVDKTIRSNEDDYTTISDYATELVTLYKRFQPRYEVSDSIFKSGYPKHLDELRTMGDDALEVYYDIVNDACTSGQTTAYQTAQSTMTNKNKVDEHYNAILQGYKKLKSSCSLTDMQRAEDIWNKLKTYGDAKSKEYKRYESMHDEIVGGYASIKQWRDSLERSIDENYYKTAPHGETRESYEKYAGFLRIRDDASKICDETSQLALQIMNKRNDVRENDVPRSKSAHDNGVTFMTDARKLYFRVLQDYQKSRIRTEQQYDDALTNLDEVKRKMGRAQDCMGILTSHFEHAEAELIESQGLKGNGGILGRIAQIFTSYRLDPNKMRAYERAKGYVEGLDDQVYLIRCDSIDLNALMTWDLTKSALEELKENLLADIDALFGRDHKAAKAAINDAGKCYEPLNRIVSEFDKVRFDELRQRGIELYGLTLAARGSYLRGNVEYLQHVIDYCNEYHDEVLKEMADMTDVLQERADSIQNDYLGLILAAGYDEHSKMYSEAYSAFLVRYYDNLLGVIDSYTHYPKYYQMLWDKEIPASLRLVDKISPEAWAQRDILLNIKREAERYLADPTNLLDIYYESIFRKNRSDMQKMLNDAPNGQCKADFDRLLAEKRQIDTHVFSNAYNFTNHYKGALHDPVDHDYAYFLGIIQQFQRDYQASLDTLEIVKAYDREVRQILSNINDSLQKAKDLHELIPDWFWKKTNVLTSVKSDINSDYRDIKFLYEKPISDINGILRSIEIDINYFNKYVVPQYEKAMWELDYLVAHHEPYMSDEDRHRKEFRRATDDAINGLQEFQGMFLPQSGFKTGIPTYRKEYDWDHGTLMSQITTARNQFSQLVASYNAAQRQYQNATDFLVKVAYYKETEALVDQMTACANTIADLAGQVKDSYDAVLADVNRAREILATIEEALEGPFGSEIFATTVAGIDPMQIERDKLQILVNCGNKIAAELSKANTANSQTQTSLTTPKNNLRSAKNYINSYKSTYETQMKADADTLKARSSRAYSAALKPLNTINSVYSNLNYYHTYAQNQYNSMVGRRYKSSNSDMEKSTTLRTYITKFETYSTDYFGKWQTLNSEISKLQEYQRGLEALLSAVESIYGKNTTQYNYVNSRLRDATNNCTTMVRSRDVNIAPNYEKAKNWPSEVPTWKSMAQTWDSLPIIIN